MVGGTEVVGVAVVGAVGATGARVVGGTTGASVIGAAVGGAAAGHAPLMALCGGFTALEPAPDVFK